MFSCLYPTRSIHNRTE